MSNLINSVFTSFRTLNALLANQGYDVSETELYDLNVVQEKFEDDKLNIIFSNSMNGKLQIFYNLSSVLREANLEDIIEEVYINNDTFVNDDILFIIIKDEMSDNSQDSINQRLKNEWERNRRLIIIMSLKRLQFNLLSHEIVPKHEIMRKEEVEEMLEKYNLKDDDNLPEISRFDPVAMCIFMKPTQVCRIFRASKTAIESIYYRKCLNI
jgi:DNA-directed RNA polymerase subunit H